MVSSGFRAQGMNMFHNTHYLNRTIPGGCTAFAELVVVQETASPGIGWSSSFWPSLVRFSSIVGRLPACCSSDGDASACRRPDIGCEDTDCDDVGPGTGVHDPVRAPNDAYVSDGAVFDYCCEL